MSKHEDYRKEQEQLSALMDDELNAASARRLLERMQSDPGLGLTWKRWHLTQAGLRSEAPADVLDGVNQALDAETRVRQQQRQVRQSRWVGFAQGALAAGLVVVAVATLWTPGSHAPGGESVPMEVQLPSAGVAAERSPQTVYWSRHVQYAGTGGQGRWEETLRSTAPRGESAL